MHQYSNLYLFIFSYFFPPSYRWLVLDTDTRDLVSMHTDGNEIISVVKYSPGVIFCAFSH